MIWLAMVKLYPGHRPITASLELQFLPTLQTCYYCGQWDDNCTPVVRVRDLRYDVATEFIPDYMVRHLTSNLKTEFGHGQSHCRVNPACLLNKFKQSTLEHLRKTRMEIVGFRPATN